MQTKLKSQQQEEYKETKLGLLPESWGVVKLEDAVKKMKVRNKGSNLYY